MNEITRDWEDYCLKNWDNDSGSGTVTPSDRVKRFLEGAANFLLLGNTKDVITDYKEMVHNVREIPMSNCPDGLSDGIYSSRSLITDKLYAQGNKEAFDNMIDGLESILPPSVKKTIDKAREGSYKGRSKKRKRKDRYTIVHGLKDQYGITHFERCVVDADGIFEWDGKEYKVTAPQYAGTPTEDGDVFYAMDKIIVGVASDGLLFFDMRFAKLPDGTVEVFEG